MAAPLLVAIYAIPVLIEGLGEERFGVLALIWMGIGYFSVFDMGLGRALTKLVSERLGEEDYEDLGRLIWTALTVLAGLGITGGVLLFFLAEPLITWVLNVPPGIQTEAITAFRVLAAGLPAVIVTAALIGLLQAHQRFATLSGIRIPLGVLTFAGPLITLQFTPSLVWATIALLVSRSLALVAYFIAAASIQKELGCPSSPRRIHMAPLFRFGGWLTVTRIIGPLMTYMDRFFVGAVLSMAAVTYYVTPYEVLSRLQMIPQSVMGVLFPAMTAAHAGERDRLPHLFGTTAWVVGFLMLPTAGLFFLLAPEALELWLGKEFRESSTLVVQWLALGWMINTLARPAVTVLQSAGRPDLVAKAHVAELVPYLLLLWSLTQAYGIAGTAAASTLRVLADTLILNEFAGRRIPEIQSKIRAIQLGLAAAIFALAVGWLLEPLSLRLAMSFLLIVVAGFALWPVAMRLFPNRNGIFNKVAGILPKPKV